MLCWVLRLSANFYSRSKPKSSPVEHFQERPLLYTQLGFVGSQHWTAEFKKITKPVLFMIFFKDFVTLFSQTFEVAENKVPTSFRHIVFLRGDKILKENHKKHRLGDSFKFCCPTQRWQPKKLIQVL